MPQPNFIFFITDQQRYDHVGYAGNKQIKTPNLDALADKGSWFSKFFVSSPTCMSNRATFMTGRMPSLHGTTHNGVPLDLDTITFTDILRAAGYKNTLIGKCHLQGMYDITPLKPIPVPASHLKAMPDDLAEAMRKRYSNNQYEVELKGKWQSNVDHDKNIPSPYYGFDDVDLCIGHGDDIDGHYRNWLEEKLSTSYQHGIANSSETSNVGAPQVFKPAVSASNYSTKYIEQQSINWLEKHHLENPEQPFFMQCSFPDPHHPFTPPGKYWSMYDSNEMVLPESFYKPNKDAIPPIKHLWDEYEEGITSKRSVNPFVTDEAKAQDITAKTFGQISMIDDAIGAVLDSLDQLDLRKNTVICFMSDHGDYLGDHGLMLKGPIHYQSVIRVPFIWCDPDDKYNHGEINSIGSTLDLAKTILTRAGLQAFNGIQGEDLLSVLSGDSIKRNVLIETNTAYPTVGFEGVTSVTTLIADGWRLSVWKDCDWGELYHLDDDPSELNNLWENANYQLKRNELLLLMVHTMQEQGETSPYPYTIA